MRELPPRGPSVTPAIAAARDQVVELLSRHYAQDAITTEELDRRLALAWQAESQAELAALVADLPATRDAMTRRASMLERADTPVSGERLLSLFAHTRKHGVWRVPAHTIVVSAFAETELDLRDAVLTSLESVVEVKAAFCELRIVVPAGVHVVNRIGAIFAEVSDLTDARPDANAPVVVLEGWAAFAQVVIRTG